MDSRGPALSSQREEQKEGTKEGQSERREFRALCEERQQCGIFKGTKIKCPCKGKWWRVVDARCSSVYSHPPSADDPVEFLWWEILHVHSQNTCLGGTDGASGSGTDLLTPVLPITAGSQHSHSDVLRDDVGPKKTNCAQ